jgi:ATP-dependent exoDNAse (exonuclease V) alpha subunit
VSIYKTKSEAISGLIRQWRDEGHAPKDTLILAATHRDVEKLNTLAHETMKEAGKLSGSPVLIGGEEFFVGSRVRFTKTSGPRGIDNGTRGTIVATDPKAERISVMTDLDDQISICVRDFPHVARGYALTVHSAQGASVKFSYLLPGGNMQDRELSYVQASRAKLQSSFHLTEVESGQAIAEFSRQIKHSRQKEMAIAVERENRLQRQPMEQTFER